ncbi:MAG TPA: lysoplasmalogenase [Anaerolineales bacterium]|jgi:uncharacterized membrane protein YhhN
MWVWPGLAILLAALNALALSKGWRRVQVMAKPAVMLCLFAWLYLTTALHGAPLWFGVGIILSLAGDILLLWPDRLFIFGLTAFALAHIAYLLGFNSPPLSVNGSSFLLALIVGLGAARILRRILQGLSASGATALRVPVSIYAVILTLMLLSAVLTLSDTGWNAIAALLVSAGAFFFFLSDIVLAWNRFLAPIRDGALINLGLYHAGQILLISGVITQYSRVLLLL